MIIPKLYYIFAVTLHIFVNVCLSVIFLVLRYYWHSCLCFQSIENKVYILTLQISNTKFNNRFGRFCRFSCVRISTKKTFDLYFLFRDSKCGYKAEYSDGKLLGTPKPMAANQVQYYQLLEGYTYRDGTMINKLTFSSLIFYWMILWFLSHKRRNFWRIILHVLHGDHSAPPPPPLRPLFVRVRIGVRIKPHRVRVPCRS